MRCRPVPGRLPARWLAAAAVGLATAPSLAYEAIPDRATQVSIRGDAFEINGTPTYAGRSWRGQRIEGLLFNARLVQGIFDDRNPETRSRWDYPDGPWDPERNTREFVAAMESWRDHGLLAFTLNLQGGSPEGYSKGQPWHNSAFDADGRLDAAALRRLDRILERADSLGMVVILGLFYFGQDERLRDEAAVVRAVDETIDWIFARGYRNVMIEVANECSVRRYDHEILRCGRIAELIRRVGSWRRRDGFRLLAGTSAGGGVVPPRAVIEASDFVLLHGNGVEDPRRLATMVEEVRTQMGERRRPVLFNEDDHYDFGAPESHLASAIGAYASWGYFDFRRKGEGFSEGFQSVPVDWRIGSDRKRAFFETLREITGGSP